MTTPRYKARGPTLRPVGVAKSWRGIRDVKGWSGLLRLRYRDGGGAGCARNPSSPGSRRQCALAAAEHRESALADAHPYRTGRSSHFGRSVTTCRRHRCRPRCAAMGTCLRTARAVADGFTASFKRRFGQLLAKPEADHWRTGAIPAILSGVFNHRTREAGNSESGHTDQT